MSIRRQALSAIITAALMAPMAIQAQPWTGAPGGAVVDEQATGIYDKSVDLLRYNSSGSTSTIVAYFNLTDTTATGAPPWTTLELSYFDNSPSGSVRAQLARFGTGATTSFASCTSTDSSVLAKRLCNIGTPIDFNAGYIYAVIITVSRSSTSADPWFMGVRLF